MTLLKTQEPTPEKVADLATTRIDLPRFALIGIFGSTETPAALIREARGAIHRVAPGDKIAGQTVAAIAEDHLILARGSRSKVLRMPGT